MCINRYNSYVDRLSSEKNPVDKSKPPILGRWRAEMHITTIHTSIAFLRRRRIPSIRINHNFKQPQIHNATAHIINHPQHSSHWQFQWKNHTLPLKMLEIPLYTEKCLKNAQHFALFEHRPKKIKNRGATRVRTYAKKSILN